MDTSEKWVVDLSRREVRACGVPVPLGSRAFDVLEVLVQSAGDLVTKDELMRRVWRGAIVEDSTLQIQISAIRKAFGPDRGMLKTVFGRGYRLFGSWKVEQRSVVAVRAGPPEQADARPFLTNLPARASDLIGRHGAIRHLPDLLSAYRIVTLTGSGGIGKTSLALEVARNLFPAYGGDVWLVELGPLSDPRLVPSAVWAALDLKVGGNEISARTVAEAIAGRKCLLVLDNCEHVVDAAASFVETLISLCPHATVLERAGRSCGSRASVSIGFRRWRCRATVRATTQTT